MGLFSAIFGTGASSNDDLSTAESYLRSCSTEEHYSSLVRHYAIEEVTDEIERQTGVALRDNETVNLVKKLRNEYGMGEIAEHNLPGYVDPDDYPEDQEATRAYHETRAQERGDGGLIGWLFGR